MDFSLGNSREGSLKVKEASDTEERAHTATKHPYPNTQHVVKHLTPLFTGDGVAATPLKLSPAPEHINMNPYIKSLWLERYTLLPPTV